MEDGRLDFFDGQVRSKNKEKCVRETVCVCDQYDVLPFAQRREVALEIPLNHPPIGG